LCLPSDCEISPRISLCTLTLCITYLPVCDCVCLLYPDPHSPFLVSYASAQFTIHNPAARAEQSLSYVEVCSSSFHPAQHQHSFSPLPHAATHPVWFYFTKPLYMQAVQDVSVDQLHSTLKMLQDSLPNPRTNYMLSVAVFCEFLEHCQRRLAMSPEQLLGSLPPSPRSR